MTYHQIWYQLSTWLAWCVPQLSQNPLSIYLTLPLTMMTDRYLICWTNEMTSRRVWRHQRGNQNLQIEEEQTLQWQKEKEQTLQWPKEKEQKDKQRSTKYTHAYGVYIFQRLCMKFGIDVYTSNQKTKQTTQIYA